MRIHLTGTGWHAGTAYNLSKAFRSLGHEVFFFEKRGSKIEKKAMAIASRLVRQAHKSENYFFRLTGQKWLKSIAEFKPDLIIIEDAPELPAEFIEKARIFGRPIFYFEIGPPHGAGARDELLNFKYVDEVFCIDRNWAKYIEIFSPKKIHHLPLAGNPDDFYPTPKEKIIYDVSFIASVPEQSPDGLIRANLANSIAKNLRVGVFGSGWKYWLRYFPELADRLGNKIQPNIFEVNKIYNQSKVVVNFHSTGHASSISSRTFEIALAGAFQITDYREDLSLLFPANYFPLYENLKEMNEQIAKWMPLEKERMALVEKQRKHILENHTWLNRAREILKTYNNIYESS